MADILTNQAEPGFYSNISVDPALALNPFSAQVVAIMGAGVPNLDRTATITRGMTGEIDVLPAGSMEIHYISAIRPADDVLAYVPADYNISVVGSAVVPAGVTALSGTSLIFSIDGATATSYTFAGATFADASAIAAEINGATAINGLIGADSYDTDHLAIYALNNASIAMGAGTSNAILGFSEDQQGNGVRFDTGATAGDFPADGVSYIVEYEAVKSASAFKPKFKYDLRSVYAEYGDPVAGNTLSLGAAGAFAGGATIVLCRQLSPAAMAGSAASKRTEISAALLELESFDFDILVPMDPISDDLLKASLYLDHVSKMSSKLERKERIVILSVNEIAGPLDVSTEWPAVMAKFNVPASSGRAPKRILVIHPGVAKSTYSGVQLTMDGSYNAAVLAGRMVSNEFDEATPMTRKTMPTVEAMLDTELSRTEKNTLTGLGVTVIDMKNGVAIVRRALTADGSSIANQEPSIVRAFDRVARELREGLEGRFVGTKIMRNTTKTVIEAATKTYLDRLVSSAIIGDYRNVRATQNSQEPRQFDISFDAVPVYPFLWGSINISIVLS